MRGRRHFVLTVFGSAALLALPIGKAAWASIEEEATSFLTDLGNQAIQQLTDKSQSEQERVDRFRDLLMTGVDFNLIAQQVAGTYWRSADPAQRDEFKAVLRETLIDRFMPLFDTYQGETFSVVATRTSSKDPTLVTATTSVIAPNGETAKVEWYMKQFDQGLRIYDFAAEGVRLTITLQDEYGTVLRQSDGDLSALTAKLRSNLPPTAKI